MLPENHELIKNKEEYGACTSSTGEQERGGMMIATGT